MESPLYVYEMTVTAKAIMCLDRRRPMMADVNPLSVLGALSKTLATIVTHPLIVAKVGLQSKPPPARNGIAFSSFVEVLRFIWEHEGLSGLFKGIGPQVTKGLLVQGILMMTKERLELGFIILFNYVKLLRAKRFAQMIHKIPIKRNILSSK
jgi:hypothetical protein